MILKMLVTHIVHVVSTWRQTKMMCAYVQFCIKIFPFYF
jgi:hypothetical protein